MRRGWWGGGGTEILFTRGLNTESDCGIPVGLEWKSSLPTFGLFLLSNGLVSERNPVPLHNLIQDEVKECLGTPGQEGWNCGTIGHRGIGGPKRRETMLW